MENNTYINKELFYYMVRHYKVFFPPSQVFNTNKPHLVVDDKFYQIEGNKKWLKQKLYNLIEEEKPELTESRDKIGLTNKTIKEFINSAYKITKE
jgi:hypothetical protein